MNYFVYFICKGYDCPEELLEFKTKEEANAKINELAKRHANCRRGVMFEVFRGQRVQLETVEIISKLEIRD